MKLMVVKTSVFLVITFLTSLGLPYFAQAQAVTFYIGSGTANEVWTNPAADHSAPPNDASGHAWNGANYDFATAAGPIPWRAAVIVNPLDPGWGPACSIAGSGLTSHWISTAANSGSGTSTDNGFFYFLQNFTIPTGYAITGATLDFMADDGSCTPSFLRQACAGK